MPFLPRVGAVNIRQDGLAPQITGPAFEWALFYRATALQFNANAYRYKKTARANIPTIPIPVPTREDSFSFMLLTAKKIPIAIKPKQGRYSRDTDKRIVAADSGDGKVDNQ